MFAYWILNFEVVILRIKKENEKSTWFCFSSKQHLVNIVQIILFLSPLEEKLDFI